MTLCNCTNCRLKEAALDIVQEDEKVEEGQEEKQELHQEKGKWGKNGLKKKKAEMNREREVSAEAKRREGPPPAQASPGRSRDTVLVPQAF